MATNKKILDPVYDISIESTLLPHEDLSTAELALMNMRNAIFSKNDIPAIVGKQADLQEVLLLAQAKLVTGMTSVTSFEELNALHEEVAAPFQSLLDAVASGELTMVHHAKGLDVQGVINEAMQATNDTAGAFK